MYCASRSTCNFSFSASVPPTMRSNTLAEAIHSLKG
jgi:hypothetical protein